MWNQVRVSTGGDHDYAFQLANCAIVERGVGAEFLGVPLLDHAEATELALEAVEVAVVIGVSADQPVAADPVDGLGALDHLTGKGRRVTQGCPAASSADRSGSTARR